MFYIENIVLECELFDVEQAITNGRMFSDRDHMNMVLNPMNVYVEHGLQDHVKWRNISRTHYIYKKIRFLQHQQRLFLDLLLRRHHRRLLRSSPIVHSCLTRINSKHSEKINSNNIVHRRDISNVRLEEREKVLLSMDERIFHLLVISPPLICSLRWSNITSVSQFGKIDDMMEIYLARWEWVKTECFTCIWIDRLAFYWRRRKRESEREKESRKKSRSTGGERDRERKNLVLAVRFSRVRLSTKNFLSLDDYIEQIDWNNQHKKGTNLVVVVFNFD